MHRDIDVNVQDKFGRTPLRICVCERFFRGFLKRRMHIQCAFRLLQDDRVNAGILDDEGKTFLQGFFDLWEANGGSDEYITSYLLRIIKQIIRLEKQHLEKQRKAFDERLSILSTTCLIPELTGKVSYRAFNIFSFAKFPHSKYIPNVLTIRFDGSNSSALVFYFCCNF